MASAKEQCFQEALDTYQRATGRDLGVEMFRPWIQNTASGMWQIEPRGFWAGVNSMLKTLKFWAGLAPKPGTAQQVRVPDLTVGGKTVVDLKFTRGDGSKDIWGDRLGKGNRQTQLHDYRQINRQTGKDVENPSLDRDSCSCPKGEPQPQEVWVPAMAPEYQFYLVPWPAPGVLPGLVPAPAPAPGLLPGLAPAFP